MCPPLWFCICFFLFSSSHHILSFGYPLNCCWRWSQCATCKLFSFCSCTGGCDSRGPRCPFLPYAASCEETGTGACRAAWESWDVLDQFGTSSQEASLVLEGTCLCAGCFLQPVADALASASAARVVHEWDLSMGSVLVVLQHPTADSSIKSLARKVGKKWSLKE